MFGGGIRGFGPIPAATGNCAAPPQAEKMTRNAKENARRVKFVDRGILTLFVQLTGTARGKNQATFEDFALNNGKGRPQNGERSIYKL